MQGVTGRSLSPRRRVVNVLMIGLCWLALGFGVAALVAVLVYVVVQGAGAVNPAFFAKTSSPGIMPYLTGISLPW